MRAGGGDGALMPAAHTCCSSPARRTIRLEPCVDADAFHNFSSCSTRMVAAVAAIRWRTFFARPLSLCRASSCARLAGGAVGASRSPALAHASDSLGRSAGAISAGARSPDSSRASSAAAGASSAAPLASASGSDAASASGSDRQLSSARSERASERPESDSAGSSEPSSRSRRRCFDDERGRGVAAGSLPAATSTTCTCLSFISRLEAADSRRSLASRCCSMSELIITSRRSLASTLRWSIARFFASSSSATAPRRRSRTSSRWRDDSAARSARSRVFFIHRSYASSARRACACARVSCVSRCCCCRSLAALSRAARACSVRSCCCSRRAAAASMRCSIAACRSAECGKVVETALMNATSCTFWLSLRARCATEVSVSLCDASARDMRSSSAARRSLAAASLRERTSSSRSRCFCSRCASSAARSSRAASARACLRAANSRISVSDFFSGESSFSRRLLLSVDSRRERSSHAAIASSSLVGLRSPWLPRTIAANDGRPPQQPAGTSITHVPPPLVADTAAPLVADTAAPLHVAARAVSVASCASNEADEHGGTSHSSSAAPPLAVAGPALEAHAGAAVGAAAPAPGAPPADPTGEVARKEGGGVFFFFRRVVSGSSLTGAPPSSASVALTTGCAAAFVSSSHSSAHDVHVGSGLFEWAVGSVGSDAPSPTSAALGSHSAATAPSLGCAAGSPPVGGSEAGAGVGYASIGAGTGRGPAASDSSPFSCSHSRRRRERRLFFGCSHPSPSSPTSASASRGSEAAADAERESSASETGRTSGVACVSRLAQSAPLSSRCLGKGPCDGLGEIFGDGRGEGPCECMARLICCRTPRNRMAASSRPSAAAAFR